MQSQRLFLLDAFALIYRGYYAFSKNPRTTSKGEDVSAIYGFLLILEEILQKEQPDRIAVVFDPPGGTFRHKEFEDYKAHRDETPDAIRFGLPFIKELLKAYNIASVEVLNYEADDVIGTLAKQAEKKGFEVFMVTPDKDYAQLVSPHISMYRPNHKGGGYQVWGEQEVCENFDLDSCSQIIDYLAFVGDKADNLMGCPNVGPKTANKLLKKYGTLEGIYQNVEQEKGKLKENLIAGEDSVRQTQYLATICTDVKVEETLDDFVRRQPNTQALEELYTKLEFRSSLSKLQRTGAISPLEGQAIESEEQNEVEASAELFGFVEEAPQKAETYQTKQTEAPMGDLFGFVDNEGVDIGKEIEASYQQEAELTPINSKFNINPTILSTKEDLERLHEQAKAKGLIAFDTETTSLDTLKAELVAISFALSETETFVLFVPEHRASALELVAPLKALFSDSSIIKIGHNLKYDMQVMLNYDVAVTAPYHDTMIAHYLIAPDKRHSLDELSRVFLDYEPLSFEDMIAPQKKKNFNLRLVEKDRLAFYAAEDSLLTLMLHQELMPKLKECEQEKLFDEIEMPLVEVLLRMERQGVRLDLDVLAEQSKALTQEMEALEEEIQAIAGYPLNVNSPKQIGELLFEELELNAKAKKTKSGSYSTSEDKLEKLRHKHPVVGKILEYRGLKKLLSTYVDTLPDLIHSDGKLHSTFNQAIAATGRLSSSNPNIQNIPIRTAQGRAIRKAFVADEGDYVFVSADYSQIELRLMAHFSGDKDLISAFCSGEDVHRATAAKINKVPIEEVSDEMRRAAKTANFGIIYGISAFGLAERLGIGRKEAKQLIEGYFASYPAVKEYMERVLEEARSKGYVSTLLGRRRYLPDLNNSNALVRGYAERNAINAPLQGTAADIIKIAMIRLDEAIKERGLKSRLILQVHDELNLNVAKEELDEVLQLLKETMQNALSLSVPLDVEAGVGTNWLEAH